MVLAPRDNPTTLDFVSSCETYVPHQIIYAEVGIMLTLL